MLAAYDESIPIASDEAMVAALGGKDYTGKQWEAVLASKCVVPQALSPVPLAR
jgi:hypothetical protein